MSRTAAETQEDAPLRRNILFVYKNLSQLGGIDSERFSFERGVADRLVASLERTVLFSYPITPGMRLRDEIDLWLWRLLRAFRVADPYRSRH